MRKRDELTDPKSCMSRARDDEWTFVLLGRDLAAPVAVRAWINERIRLGKNTWDDAQIIEAEQWIRTVCKEQLREEICPKCGGSGGGDEPYLKCRACDGTGRRKNG